MFDRTISRIVAESECQPLAMMPPNMLSAAASASRWIGCGSYSDANAAIRSGVIPYSSADSITSPAAKSSRYRPLNASRLARAREAEVDLRRARIGPARRNDLGARVELDALRPVHVQIAEERVLPAAKAVVRHRHRDRNV